MSEADNETARRALSIAEALAKASPGAKAEARRMGPEGSPVFWRQVARLGIPHWQEGQWLLFTRLVALMTPASCDSSIHDGQRPLGAALAEAKLSEQRFARLLAAREKTRDEALERAIRMLARKSPGLDVIDLARTILWPEEARRLARANYTQSDKSQTEDAQNE